MKLKWVMLVLAVLTTIVWPLSVVVAVWLSAGPVTVELGGGAVSVGERPPNWYWFKMHTDTWENGLLMMEWTPRFSWSPFSVLLPFFWIWPIICFPTVLLWSRRRKPPPTECHYCGYDLTGNTSGICPECGEKRADRGPSAQMK